MSFQIIFLLFMIYSFLGWCTEVICKSIEYKRFINRGFLMGPYCPIYGYGAIVMVVLLKDFSHNVFLLFIMSMLVCSILEYLTSFVMEKLFCARWWDYSNKKFNINGRVCLRNSLCFGLLAILLVYFINPFILDILNEINPTVINILTFILLVIFILDNVISYTIINSFSSTVKKSTFDNTEEITKYVKEEFLKRNYFSKRLIYAYPNFQTRVKRKIEEIKEAISSSLE